MSHDLAIIGGHVIDPASGLDAVTDIAFKNGQVSAIGADAGTRVRMRPSKPMVST